MYTEESIFPFGRYNGRVLKDIKRSYLINLYKGPKGSFPHLTQEIWDDLKPYIETWIENYEPGIIKRYKREYSTTAEKASLEIKKMAASMDLIPIVPIKPFPCTKVAYPNEKEAKKTIRSINKDEQKRKKIPVRTYECEKCGGWHLTSIPREEWLGTQMKKI